MITIPTVLILGAGASAPYGYPSGKVLKSQICEELKRHDSQLTQILEGQRNSWNQIEALQRSLAHSGAASIDAFLENRVEFRDMGKIAITYLLARCENTDSMFANENWYGYLFGKLGTSFEEFPNNKLSVITFNYDRSLEQYLFETISNSYGKDTSDVAKALSSIRILHMYGQIGYLPWQTGSPQRSYGPYDNTNQIVACSKGIRIIHETEVEEDPVFKEAFSILQASKRIYFFGFGYHPINIKRLRISELDGDRNTICGSSLHMTDRERTAAYVRTGNKVDLNFFNARSQETLEFMRENIDLT